MFKIKFPLLLTLLLIVSKISFSQSHKINDRTKIYTDKLGDDKVMLKVDNDLSIPVSIKVDLFLENLASDKSETVSVIVPPKVSGRTIAVMQRIVPNRPYKCTFNWRIALGDTSRTPDLKYNYSYPYIKTQSYRISQGPYGNFSHGSIFAYDFAMTIGTAICAARDGVVALVKGDSSIGGPDRKYIDDANFITIYHQDGTLAYYYHLNKDGITVKEGQFVKRGQLIGYSGNTGYSDGPHLHFEVTQSNISSDTKQWVNFKWEAEDENVLTINTQQTK